MKSVSATNLRTLADNYKTESTQNIISKGYNILWLVTDAFQMKIKAESVEGATDTVPSEKRSQLSSKVDLFHGKSR